MEVSKKLARGNIEYKNLRRAGAYIYTKHTIGTKYIRHARHTKHTKQGIDGELGFCIVFREIQNGYKMDTKSFTIITADYEVFCMSCMPCIGLY